MAGDECIRVIGTIQHRGDAKSLRHFRRHVLHRVHCDVGIALLHRDFEFLDEQTLPADFLQASVQDLVTTRG